MLIEIKKCRFKEELDGDSENTLVGRLFPHFFSFVIIFYRVFISETVENYN